MDDNSIEKKIEYWSKHQELDKFNYNFNAFFFFSLIVILCAIYIPMIISFGTQKLITPLILLSSILAITLFGLIILMLIFQSKHNRSFRIREAMLRVWYQRFKVDTDVLDDQFEKIKTKYKKRMSNKEIEDIAREVME